MIADQSLLVGGVALGMWGVDRMTGDIDFASAIPMKKLVKLFDEIGLPVEYKLGDLDDPVPWVISGILSVSETSVPFQVLPLLHGMKIENGVYSPDGSVRVIGFDDLVRSKCGAGGPQDIIDVSRLAMSYPHKMEFIKEVVRFFNVETLFERCMTSDRLIRQHARRRLPGPTV